MSGPLISFTTTIKVVKSDGQEYEYTCANHTGAKTSQEVIDSTIENYKTQIDAMRTGKVFIDKPWEKEYVIGVVIINGRKYLQ